MHIYIENIFLCVCVCVCVCVLIFNLTWIINFDFTIPIIMTCRINVHVCISTLSFNVMEGMIVYMYWQDMYMYMYIIIYNDLVNSSRKRMACSGHNQWVWLFVMLIHVDDLKHTQASFFANFNLFVTFTYTSCSDTLMSRSGNSSNDNRQNGLLYPLCMRTE